LKGGVIDTSRRLGGMSYRRDVGGSHAMNDTLRTLSLWDVWTAAHRAGVDFDGVRNLFRSSPNVIDYAWVRTST